MPVPVSVSGGYWTGSSAVIDLLAEHRDCRVIQNEFTLFSFGQFFKDVVEPLAGGAVSLSADAQRSLRRFDGFNRSDLYPFRAAGRRIGRKLRIFPDAFFLRQAGMAKELGLDYDRACAALSREIHAHLKSGRPMDACALTASVRGVLQKAMRAGQNGDGEQSHVVFDQIIAPPFLGHARPVLPEMNHIFIDRGWRDQFISIRQAYESMLRVNIRQGVRPWDEDYAQFRNLDAVGYFVALRRLIDGFRDSTCNDPDVLWVTFEGLVQKPELVAAKVFSFLGLPEDGWTPGRQFFPEISSKRIGKWTKFDGRERDILFAEFEEIARCLGPAYSEPSPAT